MQNICIINYTKLYFLNKIESILFNKLILSLQMCYSLILFNIPTINGCKTFTLRWDENEIMKWEDIFSYVSKKSILPIEYTNIKFKKKYIKYNEISQMEKFNINDIAYYDMNGNITKTGCLEVFLNYKSC